MPLTRAELRSLNNEARFDGDGEDTLIGDGSDRSSNPRSSTMQSSGTISSGKSEDTERIIVGNFTKDQALMICGPIGDDLWANIGRVEVRQNTAEGNSTMVAYATSPEALKVLLDHQSKNIAEQREWGERTKRHGTAF